MSDKDKKEEKEPKVIKGVETYYPGTKILTREYCIKSGIKR